MKITLTEEGKAVANNPQEFYDEFPELQLARVVHACILANLGYDLDPRRAELILAYNLGSPD